MKDRHCHCSAEAYQEFQKDLGSTKNPRAKKEFGPWRTAGGGRTTNSGILSFFGEDFSFEPSASMILWHSRPRLCGSCALSRNNILTLPKSSSAGLQQQTFASARGWYARSVLVLELQVCSTPSLNRERRTAEGGCATSSGATIRCGSPRCAAQS